MKFATSNANKFAEAKKILGDDLEQIDIDVDEIQSIDVVDVVEHKAKAAYAVAGEPVIVEDTGLYFEAWNNLP
jgi:inosine/xanthosine triphosphate pyrophosphatase family protein